MFLDSPAGFPGNMTAARTSSSDGVHDLKPMSAVRPVFHIQRRVSCISDRDTRMPKRRAGRRRLYSIMLCLHT